MIIGLTILFSFREVFLGATSPLGIALIVAGMDLYGHVSVYHVSELSTPYLFCYLLYQNSYN